MCKVKSGIHLTNQEDVQNLVIGIIFRQQKKYRLEDICLSVQYYIQGTQLEMNSKKLCRLVEENLDLLNRRGKLYCRNGYYMPQTIIDGQ